MVYNPQRFIPHVNLGYLIAFGIGLSRHDCGENPTKFAVASIILNAIALLLFCIDISGSLYILDIILGVIQFVFFVFGWIWFAEYTGGLNVVQYLQAYGPNEWLKMPLVLQIMYFNMWLFIALSCLAGLLLCLTLCCGCLGIMTDPIIGRKELNPQNTDTELGVITNTETGFVTA